MLDLTVLSRLQFAANITFHILFPTITIALGWFLLFFRIKANRTADPAWEKIYAFWVKVFALCFALGVVSGITMSFQFGTNWPGFMEKVGNIAGPLLGYEVLSAFFLEATFLGIMLFGRKRVSQKVHTISAALVAGGTTLSAYWILVLNSWMQTPVGYEIRANGQAYATDWLAILFNPSLPYRLSHMLVASALTASFLIAGVSAYRLYKGNKGAEVTKALRCGVFAAALLMPLQVFLGDAHGINTLEHQPAKIAAMEGIWETETGAALRLFALPNKAERRNDFEISIPYVSGLILTHSFDKPVQGLNQFADNPPVAPVFFAFRTMVATGGLMLLCAWAAAWQIARRGVTGHWVTKALIAMTFSGWVATIAGWYVTEIGRQPWLVTGVLRTADAVTTVVPTSSLQFSFIMYITLYVVLLTAFISTLFYMARRADANKY